MVERLILTVVILAGLVLLWLGWRYYKTQLMQRIPPAETRLGLPTLLYFGADYCAPCKLQQTPIVEKLATKWGEAVIVKKVDVLQQPELATQYRVLTLPTTVILNQQGEVAHINYGVASQAKLEAQLVV
ncbi:MAG: thioredoxin family protein [Anaerolineae bacterium]